MTERKLHALITPLSLASAARIIDGALAAGGEVGLLPLSIVVLDAGGHMIAMKREDGSGVLRGDIALGKAWGALGMGMSSRLIRDRLGDRANFVTALTAAADGRFVPVPGGVLILNENDEAIGAVGISGDASDKDEYCAIVGIKQAGLRSEPDSAHENWQGARL